MIVSYFRGFTFGTLVPHPSRTIILRNGHGKRVGAQKEGKRHRFYSPLIHGPNLCFPVSRSFTVIHVHITVIGRPRKVSSRPEGKHH